MISVLYLHTDTSDASPKAISGRTSYRRVRLEFLRYPQFIRQHFNGGSVRSSSWYHPTFNLIMDRSQRLRVYVIVLIRPIKTRFRYGSIFSI